MSEARDLGLDRLESDVSDIKTTLADLAVSRRYWHCDRSRRSGQY